MHILALEVGSSHVEAAVLDVATAAAVGPLARAASALDHPTPDAVEVPAERLWDAVVRAARDATRTAPDVQAVGMDVLTPGLVLLDKSDHPLAPIWMHLDRRSRPMARQVWAAVGAEFLASTGNRPLPGGMSVLGYRQQCETEPHLVRAVKRYLHVNGWLGLRSHREAVAVLGVGDKFNRVFLTGGGAVVANRLLPEYAEASVRLLEEGALRGVARLFQEK